MYGSSARTDLANKTFLVGGYGHGPFVVQNTGGGDNAEIWLSISNGSGNDGTTSKRRAKITKDDFKIHNVTGFIYHPTSDDPTKIGTENISLQGNTLVKGSDNSASTSGFKFIDSNDDSKWDFRNNGDIKVGQDVNIITESSSHLYFKFCRPANGVNFSSIFSTELLNSSNVQTSYAQFGGAIVTNTAGSETGAAFINIEKNGTTARALDIDTVNGLTINNNISSTNLLKVGNHLTVSKSTGDTTVTSTSFTPFTTYRSQGGANYGNEIQIDLNNSSNAQTTFGALTAVTESNTAGSETGRLELKVSDSGTVTTKVAVKTNTINVNMPTSSSGLSAGDLWNENGVVRIGTSGGSIGSNMSNTDLTLNANRSHNTNGYTTEYKRTTAGRNEWFLSTQNNGVSAQWLMAGAVRPSYATNSLIIGAHGSTASIGWSTSDFQNKTFMVSGYAGDHIDVYRGVNWDVYTGNAGLTSLVRRMRMNSSGFNIYLNTLIKGSDNSASTSGFKFTDSNDDSLWDFRNDGNVHLGQATTINSTVKDILTFKSSFNSNPNISLDTTTDTGVFIKFLNQSTFKWSIGNESDGTFRIYNGATSTEPFTISSSNAIEMTGNVSSTSTSSIAAFIAKGDGSSQDGYIQLNCWNNNHGIKLKAPPHSAAASYTLTFPNDTGSNGQFLKTNGSGVLSWGDVSGSSIYTADDSLTGDRTIDLLTNTLTLDGTGNNGTPFQVNCKEVYGGIVPYFKTNLYGGISVMGSDSTGGAISAYSGHPSSQPRIFHVGRFGGGEWFGTSIALRESSTGSGISLTGSALQIHDVNDNIRHDIGTNTGSGNQHCKFYANGYTNNGDFIVGASTAIGTENISLQGNTLIKGSDNSASTSGFKIVDTNDASKWDFRNDGNVHLGQDTSLDLNSNTLTVKSSDFIGFSLYRPASAANYATGIDFSLNNSSSAKTSYADIYAQIVSGSAGSENSNLDFRVADSGSLGIKLTVNTGGIVVAGNTTSESTSSDASFIAKSDGTTDGYIQLNCTANTHGIKLKSPAHSAAQSYTLTFPGTAPVNGQFLKTDASGNLSWGAAGSSSPLTTKGDVYTYGTADARLPVGTNGQALIANSSTATGLEWQALPGQSTGSGTKVLVTGSFAGSGTMQTFAANAHTKIEFDDSVTGGTDVNGEWDNTNHRFTVGTSGAGVYIFQASLFVESASGWGSVYLKKDGNHLVTQNLGVSSHTDGFDNIDGSVAVELAVGEYVEFWAYWRTGTGNIKDSWGKEIQTFSITKVGESVTVNNVVLPSLTKTIILEAPADADYIPIFRTDVAITIQEALGALMDTGDVDVRLYWDTDLANTSPTAIGASTTLTSTTEAAVDISTDPTIPANSWIFLDIGTVATAQTTVVNIRYTE
jgi:hypothetical protein